MNVSLPKTNYILIGLKNSGKSSVCNTLSGDHSRSLFTEGSSQSNINSKVVNWLGDSNQEEITLVDTQGLKDPKSNGPECIKLVEQVKALPGFKSFILVINGQETQYPADIKAIIKVFKDQLVPSFPKNIIILFTRWGFSKKEKFMREKSNEQEQKRSETVNQTLHKEFGWNTQEYPIPCFFMDNTYNNSDFEFEDSEKEEFKQQLQKLKETLQKNLSEEVLIGSSKELNGDDEQFQTLDENISPKKDLIAESDRIYNCISEYLGSTKKASTQERDHIEFILHLYKHNIVVNSTLCDSFKSFITCLLQHVSQDYWIDFHEGMCFDVNSMIIIDSIQDLIRDIDQRESSDMDLAKLSAIAQTVNQQCKLNLSIFLLQENLVLSEILQSSSPTSPKAIIWYQDNKFSTFVNFADQYPTTSSRFEYTWELIISTGILRTSISKIYSLNNQSIDAFLKRCIDHPQTFNTLESLLKFLLKGINDDKQAFLINQLAKFNQSVSLDLSTGTLEELKEILKHGWRNEMNNFAHKRINPEDTPATAKEKKLDINISYRKSIVEVTGYEFNVSQVLSTIEKKYSDAREVRFLAIEHIYIDKSLSSDFWSSKNLVVKSENISVISDSFIVINTSGKDALPTTKKAKAKDGKEYRISPEIKLGKDGDDGLDGEPGTSGGNIHIEGRQLFNMPSLKIVSNGGKGGDGQSGGDGDDGIDGKDGADGDASQYYDAMKGHAICFGQKGEKGKPGGNGGRAGLGGNGGFAGKVVVKDPSQEIKDIITARNGKRGVDGKPGQGGKGGLNGKDGLDHAMYRMDNLYGLAFESVKTVKGKIIKCKEEKWIPVFGKSEYTAYKVIESTHEINKERENAKEGTKGRSAESRESERKSSKASKEISVDEINSKISLLQLLQNQESKDSSNQNQQNKTTTNKEESKEKEKLIEEIIQLQKNFENNQRAEISQKKLNRNEYQRMVEAPRLNHNLLEDIRQRKLQSRAQASPIDQNNEELNPKALINFKDLVSTEDYTLIIDFYESKEQDKNIISNFSRILKIYEEIPQDKLLDESFILTLNKAFHQRAFQVLVADLDNETQRYLESLYERFSSPLSAINTRAIDRCYISLFIVDQIMKRKEYFKSSSPKCVQAKYNIENLIEDAQLLYMVNENGASIQFKTFLQTLKIDSPSVHNGDTGILPKKWHVKLLDLMFTLRTNTEKWSELKKELLPEALKETTDLSDPEKCIANIILYKLEFGLSECMFWNYDDQETESHKFAEKILLGGVNQMISNIQNLWPDKKYDYYSCFLKIVEQYSLKNTSVLNRFILEVFDTLRSDDKEGLFGNIKSYFLTIFLSEKDANLYSEIPQIMDIILEYSDYEIIDLEDIWSTLRRLRFQITKTKKDFSYHGNKLELLDQVQGIIYSYYRDKYEVPRLSLLPAIIAQSSLRSENYSACLDILNLFRTPLLTESLKTRYQLLEELEKQILNSQINDQVNLCKEKCIQSLFKCPQDLPSTSNEKKVDSPLGFLQVIWESLSSRPVSSGYFDDFELYNEAILKCSAQLECLDFDVTQDFSIMKKLLQGICQKLQASKFDPYFFETPLQGITEIYKRKYINLIFNYKQEEQKIMRNNEELVQTIFKNLLKIKEKSLDVEPQFEEHCLIILANLEKISLLAETSTDIQSQLSSLLKELQTISLETEAQDKTLKDVVSIVYDRSLQLIIQDLESQLKKLNLGILLREFHNIDDINNFIKDLCDNKIVSNNAKASCLEYIIDVFTYLPFKKDSNRMDKQMAISSYLEKLLKENLGETQLYSRLNTAVLAFVTSSQNLGEAISSLNEKRAKVLVSFEGNLEYVYNKFLSKIADTCFKSWKRLLEPDLQSFSLDLIEKMRSRILPLLKNSNLKTIDLEMQKLLVELLTDTPKEQTSSSDCILTIKEINCWLQKQKKTDSHCLWRLLCQLEVISEEETADLEQTKEIMKLILESDFQKDDQAELYSDIMSNLNKMFLKALFDNEKKKLEGSTKFSLNSYNELLIRDSIIRMIDLYVLSHGYEDYYTFVTKFETKIGKLLRESFSREETALKTNSYKEDIWNRTLDEFIEDALTEEIFEKKSLDEVLESMIPAQFSKSTNKNVFIRFSAIINLMPLNATRIDNLKDIVKELNKISVSLEYSNGAANAEKYTQEETKFISTIRGLKTQIENIVLEYNRSHFKELTSNRDQKIKILYPLLTVKERSHFMNSDKMLCRQDLEKLVEFCEDNSPEYWEDHFKNTAINLLYQNLMKTCSFTSNQLELILENCPSISKLFSETVKCIQSKWEKSMMCIDSDDSSSDADTLIISLLDSIETKETETPGQVSKELNLLRLYFFDFQMLKQNLKKAHFFAQEKEALMQWFRLMKQALWKFQVNLCSSNKIIFDLLKEVSENFDYDTLESVVNNCKPVNWNIYIKKSKIYSALLSLYSKDPTLSSKIDDLYTVLKNTNQKEYIITLLSENLEKELGLIEESSRISFDQIQQIINSIPNLKLSSYITLELSILPLTNWVKTIRESQIFDSLPEPELGEDKDLKHQVVVQFIKLRSRVQERVLKEFLEIITSTFITKGLSFHGFYAQLSNLLSKIISGEIILDTICINKLTQKKDLLDIAKIMKEYSTTAKQSKNRNLKIIVNEMTENPINKHLDLSFDSDKKNSLDLVGLVNEVKAKMQDPGCAKLKIGEIKDWAARKMKNPSSIIENFVEVLAYIVKAVELAEERKVRDTQLLALLLYINAAKKGKSRLGQISTGEGKTLITAMFAIFQCLQSKTVQVITSSSVLANRDAKKVQGLLGYFGISVSTNCDKECEDPEIRKKRYKSHVLYGELSYFQRDYLLTKVMGQDICSNYYPDCVIIDEVDSLLLDKGQNVLYLSQSISDLHFAKNMFFEIWNAVNAPDVDIGQIGLDACKIKVEDFMKTRISEMKNEIPNYLKDFIQRKLKIWIDSAFFALEVEENDPYTISTSDGGCKRGRRVVVVDKDTGVEQDDLKWSNGVHQFIQLKHGEDLATESLKGIFISNVTYFKLFENRMYGATGTIGSEADRNLLSKIYNVDFFILPRFQSRIFIEEEGCVCNQESSWLQEIKSDAQKKIDENRSVLVICENIASVWKVREALAKKPLANARSIHTYSRSSEELKVGTSQNPLSVRSVVIATNLAGRGTDLIINEELRKNGGIHVILTYIPTNVRVEEQAFGRAARNGEEGSGKTIIFSSKKANLDSLKNDRDELQSLLLEGIRVTKLQAIILEEKYFQSFIELQNQIRNELKEFASNDNALKICRVDAEYIEIQLRSLQTHWAFWLDSEHQNMQDLSEDKIQPSFVKFKTEMLSLLRKNDYLKLVKSPLELVRLGSHFADKKLYNLARECYDVVIKEDPHFSEISHYYKGACLISEHSDIVTVPSVKKEIKYHFKKAKVILTAKQGSLLTLAEVLKVIDANRRQKGFGGVSSSLLLNQLHDEVKILEVHIDAINQAIGVPCSPSMFKRALTEEQSKLLYNRLLEKNIIKRPRVSKKVEIQRDPKNKRPKIIVVGIDGNQATLELPDMFDYCYDEVISFLEEKKSSVKDSSIKEEEIQAKLSSSFAIWEDLRKYNGLSNIEDNFVTVIDTSEEQLELMDLSTLGLSSFANEIEKKLLYLNEKKYEEEDFKDWIPQTKMKEFTLLLQTKQIIKNKNVFKGDLVPSSQNFPLQKYSTIIDFINKNKQGEPIGETPKEFAKPQRITILDIPVSSVKNQARLLHDFLLDNKVLKPSKLNFNINDRNDPKEHLKAWKKEVKTEIKKFIDEELPKAETGIWEDIKQFFNKGGIRDQIDKDAFVGSDREKKNMLYEALTDSRGSLGIAIRLKLEYTNIETLFQTGTFPIEVYRQQEISFLQVLKFNFNKRSWWDWKAFCVAMIGASQIILGFALEAVSVGALTFVASRLVAEGAGDILFAIQSAAGNGCKWQDYWDHKKFSVAVTVITGGVGAWLARSAQASKFSGLVGKELCKAVGGEIAKKCFKATAFAFIDLGVQNVCQSISEKIKMEFEPTIIREMENDKEIQRMVESIRENIHKINEKMPNNESVQGFTRTVFSQILAEVKSDENLERNAFRIASGLVQGFGSAAAKVSSHSEIMFAKSQELLINKLHNSGAQAVHTAVKQNNKASVLGKIAKFSGYAIQAAQSISQLSQILSLFRSFFRGLNLILQRKIGSLTLPTIPIRTISAQEKETFEKHITSFLKSFRSQVSAVYVQKINLELLQPSLQALAHSAARKLGRFIAGQFSSKSLRPSVCPDKKNMSKLDHEGVDPDSQIENGGNLTLKEYLQVYGESIDIYRDNQGKIYVEKPSFQKYLNAISEGKESGILQLFVQAAFLQRDIEVIDLSGAVNKEGLATYRGTNKNDKPVLRIAYTQKDNVGHFAPLIIENGVPKIVEIAQSLGTKNCCLQQALTFLQCLEKTDNRKEALDLANNADYIRNQQRLMSSYASKSRNLQLLYEKGVQEFASYFFGGKRKHFRKLLAGLRGTAPLANKYQIRENGVERDLTNQEIKEFAKVVENTAKTFGQWQKNSTVKTILFRGNNLHFGFSTRKKDSAENRLKRERGILDINNLPIPVTKVERWRIDNCGEVPALGSALMNHLTDPQIRQYTFLAFDKRGVRDPCRNCSQWVFQKADKVIINRP